MKTPADITPKQAIKALERLGFQQTKQRGSHVRLKHPDGRWTQVAVHSRPIPQGTLKSILDQTKLTQEDFITAVK